MRFGHSSHIKRIWRLRFAHLFGFALETVTLFFRVVQLFVLKFIDQHEHGRVRRDDAVLFCERVQFVQRVELRQLRALAADIVRYQIARGKRRE